MNVKKILTVMSGAVIAFVALAFTISILSKAPAVESSTEAVFVNSPKKQTATVNPGGLISEKGSLKFGEFALFQLTNEETELEFVSAEFDEKMRVIISARGRVNSGSVLAVNLLFGSELTLLDDRVAATNRGGSFIFEKNVEANSTQIRVLSGNAKLTFLDTGSSEMFEGVLLAGEEAELTNEVVVEIFRARDKIARVAAWKQKVGKFSSKFEGENRLTSKILESLPPGKSNALLAGFNFVREKLLFNPKVKENFYAEQFAGLLAEVAAGDTRAVDDFLANPNPKNRAQLQKIVARAIPFTRLFLTESLSPSAKEKITRLADFSAPFSAFAEIADLSIVNELNRNLIFISDDSNNTKRAQTFLNRAESGIEEADAETAELLLAILERDIETVNSDWLEAWTAVNRARIVTDLDLAAAITDQLSFVKFLVESGREELAGDALRELVGLLSRGREKFSEVSLEKIAVEGSELKNRILFLASLHGEVEFEEEAYREWVTERERIEAEKVAEESEPKGKTSLEKPCRVARPQSEFEKFLDLSKEKIPPSPTQTTEEEFNPDFETAGPPTVIYKTKEDYYNLVPVMLSEDKTKIVGYPDITDVSNNGALAYPTKLNKEYLLDNRGLSGNSAFLEITYEEYSKLSETPSSAELFDMILDDNPFIEIYDCGNRYQFEDNEVSEINSIVNSGQLSKCKSLNAILLELERLNIEITGDSEQVDMELPSTLSDPNWGMKKMICEEGGYDISAYAGKTLLFTSYLINEVYENKEPLKVWIVSGGNKIVCVYKTVREGSTLVPGIFSVKDNLNESAATLENAEVYLVDNTR